MLVKGERGRKSLFGKQKGKKGEVIAPLQNHMIGRRVDGMDAYSHVTAVDVKKEEGWWFKLPKWKQRVWWRVKMIDVELNETINKKSWHEKNKNKKLTVKFPEYIDYYLGKRIKTKYAYHPYKLTFDYLQLNALEALKLYWVFSKADRDGSGIIDCFEWLMYLDVERTEFTEKVR